MKDKKITLVFILIAVFSLLGMIGFTLAFFTSSVDFENEFEAATYQIDTEEVFTSPTDWLPGDTTQKELTIQNTGNIDVKARVCPEEEWISNNGDNLPLEQNGNRVAIINLANTNDWTKKGYCYYYNDILEPNDITSSFMSSVTYNEETIPDLICTSNTVNGVTTRNCNSSGDGYDNATYILTLHVETVQADKASEEWNIIRFVNRTASNDITIGDEITIKGENFYVVSSDSNKTILLSKYNLLVGKEYSYSGNSYTSVQDFDDEHPRQNSRARGYVNNGYNVGVVPFSSSNYWDYENHHFINNNQGTFIATYAGILYPEFIQNGETYYSNPHNTNYPYVYRSNLNTVAPVLYGRGSPKYNGYTIAYFVEKYVGELQELTEYSVESITGRLLSVEEVIDFGCSETTCRNTSAPTWLYNTSYWLGSVYTSRIVWSVKYNGNFGKFESDSSYYKDYINGVRPVIEIPTSAMPQ